MFFCQSPLGSRWVFATTRGIATFGLLQVADWPVLGPVTVMPRGSMPGPASHRLVVELKLNQTMRS